MGDVSSDHRGRPPVHDMRAQLDECERRILTSGPSGTETIAGIVMAAQFPGVFAAVYDAAGRYIWASHAFGTMMGLDPETLLGRKIDEVFESDWAGERLAIFRRVVESGLPLATVEILRGQRMESAVLPIATPAGEPAVGYLGRFGLVLPVPERSNGIGVIADRARHARSSRHAASTPGHAPLWPFELLDVPDWGKLAVLTLREKEVLRLIAMGLGNDQIAERIHRTKRAVEFHIKKLYEYLSCDRRTDLFRFGLYAGLAEIDEAHWSRMLLREASELDHQHR